MAAFRAFGGRGRRLGDVVDEVGTYDANAPAIAPRSALVDADECEINATSTGGSDAVAVFDQNAEYTSECFAHLDDVMKFRIKAAAWSAMVPDHKYSNEFKTALAEFELKVALEISWFENQMFAHSAATREMFVRFGLAKKGIIQGNLFGGMISVNRTCNFKEKLSK